MPGHASPSEVAASDQAGDTPANAKSDAASDAPADHGAGHPRDAPAGAAFGVAPGATSDAVSGAPGDSAGDAGARAGDRAPGQRPPAEPRTQPAPHPALGAGLALLAAVFALDVFRGLTQSLTHDEALTFHYYLARPFGALFGEYDPNHHVLHTLLAWCSVRLLGVSEGAVRLPALLGGLLYLVAARNLCRRAFGTGWTHLLAFALLALHPLLLDFQSAARGYGLALAFALLALERLLAAEARDETDARRAARAASLALGASLAANLTLAPVVVALGALVAWHAWRDDRRTSVHSAIATWLRWAWPGVTLATALLVPAMAGAHLERFVVGTESLGASVDELLGWTLAHQPDAWPLAPDGAPRAAVQAALRWALLPLLLVALALWSWRCLAARGDPSAIATGPAAPGDRSATARWLGPTLLIGLGLLGVLHLALGTPWPVNRTGLWLIAFAQLAAVGLARDALTGSRPARAAGRATLVLLFVLLVQQISQVQSREYGVWRRDASGRELFDALERERHRAPQAIACDWYDQPVLNFYRHARKATWMPWLERTYDLDALRYDWIVFRPADDAAAAARLAEVLYRDPVTGTVLGLLRQEP